MPDPCEAGSPGEAARQLLSARVQGTDRQPHKKPQAKAWGGGSHDLKHNPLNDGVQPSTVTTTLLTLLALGAVTVSRPSRYTAWSCSRSIGCGKRKLRLQVP